MTAPDPMRQVTVVPWPATLCSGSGRLTVTASLRVFLSDPGDRRVQAGVNRALRRLEERTGLMFARQSDSDFVLAEHAATATWVIDWISPGSDIPRLGEDESYVLEVTSTQATLRAPTALGVLHGLETCLQLLQSHATGWYLPEATINDRPRFPWRGLMIDVVRHWQPVEVILRNLDGMALVKLNVLHLHLTDDQGFRIESTTCPLLHERGSDGHYFTHEQIRQIIAYAAERGIRVVPELDIPGHATSWLVGHPELASAPGPYVVERMRGIFDPVLDPTQPRVYAVLERVIGEMAALFPDAFLHIGGDENNGVHWSANPDIQAFIREHHLHDNAGLHAYFNQRIHTFLERHGKHLVGWDEVLHPQLPADSVVQSWRGADGISEATKQGFQCIRSHGYYIDLSLSVDEHYLNDPAPEELDPAQQSRVLGGEATMWGEWVTPETIDSRIWPRSAAIAERFWSPREVRDVPDLHRRLPMVSRRLEEAGLRHRSYVEPALRRLAGDDATPSDLAALRVLVDLLEPVKIYRRNELQAEIDLLAPLTGLADCARPDSPEARAFAYRVERVCSGHFTPADLAAARQQLFSWKSAAETLSQGLCVRSPRLQDALPLVQILASISDVGIDALQALNEKQGPGTGWKQAHEQKLETAGGAWAATELPIVGALRHLVATAAAGSAPAQI